MPNPNCKTHTPEASPACDSRGTKRRHNAGFSRGLVLGLIGVLALAALIVVLGVFLLPSRSDVPERSFASPEEYSAHVLEEEIGSVSTAAAELYDRRVKTDLDLNSLHQDLRMTFRLGDSCLQLLRDSMETDFSWLDTAALNFSLDRSLEQIFLSVGLDLNGGELLRGEALSDLESRELTVQVPALSERWFSLDLEELLNALAADNPYLPEERFEPEAMEQAAEAFEALPDGAGIENLLKTYLSMAAEALRDVTKEEDAGLTVGELTVPCTKLSYVITEGSLEPTLRKLYTAMQTDEDLAAIIRYLGQSMGRADAYDDFSKALSDELAREKLVTLEGNLNLTLWVEDAAGALRGLELRQENGGGTVAVLCPRTADRFALELAFREASADAGGEAEQPPQFLLTGTGSFEGELFSGSFTASNQEDALMDAEVRELDLAALRQGELRGVLTLKPTREFWAAAGDGDAYTARLLESYSLELSMNTEGNHAEAALRILDGGDFFAGVDVTGDAGAAKDISVQPENPMAAEDWVSLILMKGGLRSYVKSLYDTAIPKEYVDLLSQYVSQLILLYALQSAA